MKTSNKLFITAILIIVISMIGYDLALRAEYRKGEYKNRFYGMDKIHFNGFTKIENRAANLISMEVEEGNKPEIWIAKDWRKHLKIFKNGTTLVVEFVGKQTNNLFYYPGKFTIICPALDAITTIPVIDNQLSENYNSESTTTIKGFDLQSLVLDIGKNSGLILEKNKINSLQATVGNKSSENARLTISSDNQIKLATVNVPGKNFLTLENPVINKTNFTVSDSATVSASGRLLKQFQK